MKRNQPYARFDSYRREYHWRAIFRVLTKNGPMPASSVQEQILGELKVSPKRRAVIFGAWRDGLRYLQGRGMVEYTPSLLALTRLGRSLSSADEIPGLPQIDLSKSKARARKAPVATPTLQVAARTLLDTLNGYMRDGLDADDLAHAASTLHSALTAPPLEPPKPSKYTKPKTPREEVEVIHLSVRHVTTFYFGSATYGDRTFTTVPYTTAVGAKIAALGAVQAALASEVVEELLGSLDSALYRPV